MAGGEIEEDRRCPHLPSASQLTRMAPKFAALVEERGRRVCSTCATTVPHIWLCVALHCLHIGCGRMQRAHAATHYQQTKHAVTLNLKSGRLWCYACDDEPPQLSGEGSEEEDYNATLTTLHDLCITREEELAEQRHRRVVEEQRKALAQEEKAQEEKAQEEAMRLRAALPSHKREEPLHALPRSPADGKGEKAQRDRVDYGALVPFRASTREGDERPRQQCGLANLGNTCYMNATLQGLFHVHALQLLLSQECEAFFLLKPQAMRLTQAMASLFHSMTHSSSAAVAPREFFRCVRATFPAFDGYGQQDAHEFLRCVLDKLQEEFASLLPRTERMAPEERDKAVQEERNTEGERKSERNVIDRVFGGLLCSSVRCYGCKAVSNTKEAFTDLSLGIPSGQEVAAAKALEANQRGWFSSMTDYIGMTSRPSSLETCLQVYCQAERLSGADQYQCEKCTSMNDCDKRFVVEQLPEVLCLHLKRFKYAGYGSKLTNAVSFPLQGLDMAPYTRDVGVAAAPSCIYDLTGVVCHSGGLGGGHYIGYAKDVGRSVWHQYDDQRVQEVGEATVAEAEAYILFYRQRTPAEVEERRQAVTLAMQQGITRISRAPEAEVTARTVHYSRLWKQLLLSLNEPGDCSHALFTCRHGALPPAMREEAANMLNRVPRETWERIIGLYQCGPPVECIAACAKCEEEIQAMDERREEERTTIRRIDRTELRAGEVWCLIENQWLQAWLSWVRRGSEEPPGRIANERLLTEDRERPRRGLRNGVHYKCIVPEVWRFFVSAYGGGPPIFRASMNIYDEPAPAPAASGL